MRARIWSDRAAVTACRHGGLVMNTVQSWKALKATIDAAWAERRVTPPRPRSRMPSVNRANEQPDPPRSKLRDRSSGWGCYIAYVDSGGYESERRITCIRYDRAPGGQAGIGSFCHEAQEYRLFRIDRIRELIDLATGEVCEPADYFARLRRDGLPISDRGLEALSKILVFMMRCDGHSDPREVEAIERALTSYVIRYDGSDEDLQQAVTSCVALAPDATDFALAMRRILRTPREVREAIANLTGRACADVVDADGRLVDAELHWGAAVDRCLAILKA